MIRHTCTIHDKYKAGDVPFFVARSAHLYALPDDVLRAMDAFMPPSGLLTMARCSRRLSTVLRGEVSRRLAGLYFVDRGC
jgi:hypothetical protein